MALRITHDMMTLGIDNHVVATAGSAKPGCLGKGHGAALNRASTRR
jgi:hypothetical protein